MKNFLHKLPITDYRILITLFFLLFAATSFATTFYVGQSGSPGGTYFTDIQSAVNATADGDVLIVSNGTYILNDQIEVKNSLIIQSVGGFDNTIIDGNTSNRCFMLSDKNIVLDGFTITNGVLDAGNGAGICCDSVIPKINNCKIVGNTTVGLGGGVYKGTINNCIIRNNKAAEGGGARLSVVNNSAIIKNLGSSSGGGVLNCVVNNCTIVLNSAYRGGGTWGGTVTNSIIYYNSAVFLPNKCLGTYDYCCTTADGTNGIGNILAEPMLLSVSHIATNSPCIGAGFFDAVSGVDIDGETWKNPPAIGCDEVYENAIDGPLSVSILAERLYTYIDNPLNFDADISGNLYQNTWDLGDTVSVNNKIQITYSWDAIGEYILVLSAYNSTHPAGVSNSVIVKIVPKIHYVNINNPSPVMPYSTWETAATNIQDAVGIADNGGEIIVTNGFYLLDSSINVNKTVAIKSVNGPENTIIDGNSSDRCFNITSSNSFISGFTITNGNSGNNNGGGIYCSDVSTVITNCIITGNSGDYGGGVYKATIYNCNIEENKGTSGGGIYKSVVINSIIRKNYASLYGGGTYYGTINNSIINENSSGDVGGGASHGDIYNCTIVRNSAKGSGGGTYFSTVYNSIVYYNSAPFSPNRRSGTYRYSCTTPSASGTGNISSEPNLVNSFRLGINSPCIGAGTNGYSSGFDIDGEPWGSPPSMGCDELYTNNLTGELSVQISSDNIYGYINQPLTFYADIEGKVLGNFWTFDDGTSDTNKCVTTHSWNAFGEYNVVLKAVNNTYPQGVSNSISIKIITNVLFVNLNNLNPISPYSSWETAATNIQDAVDIANDNATIFVTNGTYFLTSEIAVDKELIIQSVNGPENTIIDGNNLTRCFNLYRQHSILSGFTIQNGNAGNGNGGGVYSDNRYPMITNCIITGNSAGNGGGTYSGTINNCIISKNIAKLDGGGAYYGEINNSSISENYANDDVGGVYFVTANNCTISGNSAKDEAGGSYDGTLNNSIVYYNYAHSFSNRMDGTYNYCCTTPDSTNGIGNISSEPILLSAYYIAATSPCIGAGSNAFTSGVDIDGEPWKNPPAIGCDEVYASGITGSLSVTIIPENIYAYVGMPLTFYADIKGKLSQNIWTFGDASAEIDKIQIAHSWTDEGDYNVTLLAKNNTYPAGISDSISIKVITNVHFVNLNNLNPIAPYSSWETAATNIQNVIDIANSGGIILVTNGHYILNSQIDVDKDLIIKSVNGPENTIIDGNNSNRCFYLSFYNSVISGFTITNGNPGNGYGGGIFCSDLSTVITNCVITKNKGMYAGGIYRGSVYNCTIAENTASANGGGACFSSLFNCLVTENNANSGGGFYSGIINNCTIVSNTAAVGGGASFGSITNSIIWNNLANVYSNNYYKSDIKYSCSFPLPNGIGNISNNPEFVSSINKNWRLKANSPCFNAGINSAAPMPVDLDGFPRIIDGTVDMGCYEFSFPPFIDITNYPPVVEFDITSATISGTNLNISGNMSVVNSMHAGVTNLVAQGFATTINFLEHGDNIITLFGENIYNQSTSSVVTIRRKTSTDPNPQIATNALIFPSLNSELFEGDLTNIIWDVDKITDDVDGTDLTISKISILRADDSSEVGIITNDISNLIENIGWVVPDDLVAAPTAYVLKFDVIDSESLTTNRIFWNNEFTVIPEPGFYLLFIIYQLIFINRRLKSR